MESEDYTGGICGKGYTMQNCISIPAILGDGEAKGSLAGIIESDGEVSTNIFVNDIYGGIDDINYSGKADSASYEAVMAMENIPDGFHRVTLVFKADGNVIDTKILHIMQILVYRNFPQFLIRMDFMHNGRKI